MTAFSVVVPIHNEAVIVCDCLARMLDDFRAFGQPFEIIACENGSTDGTPALIAALAATYPEVRVERLAVADYGRALKHGILAARYPLVAVVNLDFWNPKFVAAAMAMMDGHDMVIGSKAMAGSGDRRPLLRRVITRSFNRFLRLAFGFRGTDTHGVKVFDRQNVASIAAVCVTDQFIFDTELVLRTERAGLRVTEIPVDVEEIRAPGYQSLLLRTPRVLWNLLRLRHALPPPR
jgi:glycosyltransferase involved in cell wall biosynthesis